MRSQSTLALPSDDKRWKIIQATMRRNGFRSDALIETLHAVQDAFGFLGKEALLFVADALNVAPSQVYGVATFYHYFQLRPQADHVCSVCTGTACHIKGAQKLLDALEAGYGIGPGETTSSNEVSVLTVRCIGACGLAPAVVFDKEVVGKVSVDQLNERIEGFLNHDNA